LVCGVKRKTNFRKWFALQLVTLLGLLGKKEKQTIGNGCITVNNSTGFEG